MVDEPEQEGQDEASNPVTSAQRLTELSADPHLRLVVASNPSAPVKLLAHLSQDQDEQVRQAVAGNPNTPWKTLEQLAWEFPREFLANAGGPLQILAGEQEISTSSTFWEVLLRSEDVPAAWLSWLGSRSDVPEHLALALRLHILNAGETSYFAGQLQREEAGILLELLMAARGQGIALPALELSGQTVVSGEQIIGEHCQWLAQHGDISVRKALAGNAQSPSKILRELVWDANADVRGALARNARISPEIARILSRDLELPVRRDLAGNAQLAQEIVLVLARDESLRVREIIAAHPRASEEILRGLAVDLDRDVRWNVAKNPNTPGEAMSLLAQDKDLNIRGSAASHRQTPAEALRALAQEGIGEPPSPIPGDFWLKEEGEIIRSAVARNPNIPGEVLRDLARDADPSVRKTVAEHPNTPLEILHDLARDASLSVRDSVARNPNASQEILQDLARNQQNSQELYALYMLAEVARNPNTPLEILHDLAQSQNDRVRHAVAQNPRAPVEVLRELAQDQFPLVSAAVAWNPATPAEVLWELARHADANTRRRASICSEIESLLPQARQKQWFQALDQCMVWSSFTIEDQLERMLEIGAPEKVNQALLTVLAADWGTEQLRLPMTRDHWRESVLFACQSLLALQKLATSPFWEVRYLVALHPQTPWETRQHLCQDGNRYVRAIARAASEQIPNQQEGGHEKS